MLISFKTRSVDFMALVACLFCFSSHSAFSAWVSVSSGGSGVMAAASFTDLIVADEGCSGLHGSTNGGSTWNKLGGAGGNNVTNGGNTLFFDPVDPGTFWEAGMYGGSNANCSGWGPGVFKGINGGSTIIAVAGFNHMDGFGVDFSDPQRLTQIAVGHEEPGAIYKSVDGGISSYSLKSKFPTGTTTHGACCVIDSLTYVVTCIPYAVGTPGIYRSTDGGNTWAKVSTQITLGTGNGAGLIRMTSTGTIFATAAQSGTLLKGSSDGATWSSLSVSGYGSGTPTELPGGKLAVAGNNAILISSNEGSSWQSIAAGNPGKTGVFYNRTRGALYCYQVNGGIWRFDTTISADPDIYALTSAPVAIANTSTQSVTFSVHAATSSGTISSVIVDLSAVGGSSTVAMTHGAGDLYTATFSVPAGIGAGIKNLTAAATSSTSNKASISGAITIVAPPVSSLVKPLYADTSTVQATFGWYGNGAGNDSAATGCSATEAKTGGSEASKCLDFQFSINQWWAGFNLSWNKGAYTAITAGYDSICFDFKTTNNVRFALHLALPDTETVAAELLFSGGGLWQHAAIPFAFYRTCGYNVDSLVGFAITMKGQDGYNPASGHLYLDNIYMVGAGSVGAAQHAHPGAARRAVDLAHATTYDIRGRVISKNAVVTRAAHRSVPQLCVVRTASGNTMQSKAIWFR